ncbi:hypothetical protein [Amycolatopsis pigmentata]|uniref:ESX-1 secretion-associated protein n=1 Tax=Amycolatopsis pigmentata TaxID=450801 RepID=A0ABW5FWU0_9PSEU
MDFHVDPEALKQYAEVLENLSSVIDAIAEYMHDDGCDKSGFTGLFMVLQPAVDLVGSLYGDTLKIGKQRMASLVEGVNHAASSYEHADSGVHQVLKGLLSDIDTSAVPVIA